MNKFFLKEIENINNYIFISPIKYQREIKEITLFFKNK